MALGAFGPWVTVLGISVDGTNGDGWLVLGAAGVAALALLLHRRRPSKGKALWALLGGAVGTAITIYDRNNLSSAINDGGTLTRGLAQVGWGLNLALIASISLGIAGLVVLLGTPRHAAQAATTVDSPAYRECPHCKEPMRRDASVCPHCQRDSEAWTLNDGAWWVKRDGAWIRYDEETGNWKPVTPITTVEAPETA
jgi:hypothetical protein